MLNKLKLLIEQKSYTQTLLAEKSGVARTVISEIFNGTRRLNDETAKKLLIGLDYRPSEAEKMIAEWKLEDAAEKAKELGVQSTAIDALLRMGAKPLEEGDYEPIPRLGSAACGYVQGDKIRSTDILGYDLFPRQNLHPKKNYFTVVADGLSMQGEIENEDIVLVECCTTNVPGKIMLVQYDEDCAFGYLFERRGLWSIEKANKTFPPIPVDDERFRIIGMAKEIKRSL